MPDFLTRRDGTWHFVRRVPAEFAPFDARRIVKHSTRVRVRDDRNARRASRIADKLNSQLEAFWRAAAQGPAQEQLRRYDTTRQYVWMRRGASWLPCAREGRRPLGKESWLRQSLGVLLVVAVNFEQRCNDDVILSLMTNTRCKIWADSFMFGAGIRPA
jgi:hypothetical protein